jgi:transcriptional antiterminator NusG
MAQGLPFAADELCPADTRRITKMHLAYLGRVERLDGRGGSVDLYSGRFHRPGGSDFLPNPLLVETVSVMRSQWFVIHTLSGQEQKVKESIEKRIKPEEMGDFIKEVLVPMERVVEVRNQKKTVSTRKLWPGYVFVDMVLLDENHRIIEKPWYFIKETQGVIGFVGGEPPTPTPAEEVESIKNQISASEEHEKPKVSFEIGETVKINNGPFLNFSGVIEEVEPERGKLKVTVNIFGRNTPVELEYWQVEKG